MKLFDVLFAKLRADSSTSESLCVQTEDWKVSNSDKKTRSLRSIQSYSERKLELNNRVVRVRIIMRRVLSSGLRENDMK